MTSTVWEYAAGHQIVTTAAMALSAMALWLLARKVRKIARSEKPDETLATIGMLIGIGWTGEATWVICTQLMGLPIAVTVVLLFALEVNLAVAMIRSKRHHRLHGHPGTYGTTAWIIAGAMALIASFASQSAAEFVLRIAIPLLVTKTWWDGFVTTDAIRKLAGITSWRWTPRRFLLWVGAIEPGERDVESVNRERLTQQMTNLEFARRHGNKRTASRCAKKLARLSLTADDAIISEVRQRVARSSWFTVTPLSAIQQQGGDAAMTQPSGAPLTRTIKGPSRRVEVPPTRRGKLVTHSLTSGDADDADPSTIAANLYLTRQVDSIREAARRVPGASDATVRRRVNKARGAGSDAPGVPEEGSAVTQIPEPVDASSTPMNGNPYPSKESTQ